MPGPGSLAGAAAADRLDLFPIFATSMYDGYPDGLEDPLQHFIAIVNQVASPFSVQIRSAFGSSACSPAVGALGIIRRATFKNRIAAVMVTCALLHYCIFVDTRSPSLDPCVASADRRRSLCETLQQMWRVTCQRVQRAPCLSPSKVTNVVDTKGSDHRSLVLALQVGRKLSIDEKQHVFAELPVAFRSTSHLLAALAKTD